MLYFKDCIGKTIVRCTNDPSFNFSSGTYRNVGSMLPDGTYNWVVRRTKDGSRIPYAPNHTKSKWDDGYWELYEPEEKEEEEKEVSETSIFKGHFSGLTIDHIWYDEIGDNMIQKRIVNIVVADKDSDVGIKDSVLYHKCNVVTDKSDEEIWFDIKLDKLIEAHNTKKAKMKDADGDALLPLTLEHVLRSVTVVLNLS